MLQHLKFKLLKALPRKHRGVVHKVLFNPHKQRVLLGIVALYATVISLIGYGLLNQPVDESSAYYPAELVAALRVQDTDSLEAQKPVTFELTLQNSSPNESINNVNLRLLSTSDALQWNEVTSNESGELYQVDADRVQLSSLAAGERSTYTLAGDIINKNLDSVSILGKLTYATPQGAKRADTNREFLALNPSVDPDITNYLSLGSDSQTYQAGQAVSLVLSKNGVLESDIEGKVFVSNRSSQEVVASENCNLSDTDTCTINVTNLKPGAYSALFSDTDNQLFSQISQFEVLGGSDGFVPDEDTTLFTGFGPASINGTAYVYATGVAGNNGLDTTNNQCVFDITRNGETVSTINSSVNANNDCIAKVVSSSLPEDGIYTVSLRESSKTVDVAFAKKTAGLLTLKNNTTFLDQEKPVEIVIENVTDQYNEPLDGEKATVHILHSNSGESEEIKSLDGESLRVKAGKFSASVPSNYFIEGGSYYIYVSLEDGKQTDTIKLNFNSNEAGHTSSGVIVNNYDSLRIGQPIEVTVSGVKDKNGNTITSGDCGVEVYTTGDAVDPLFVSGTINSGNCKATIGGDLITTSGPSLISLSGRNINTDIAQSRQISIKPGVVDNYGFLNLEYESARIGYANNLIIGPVTDIYGNTTNANNLTLAVVKENKIIHQVEDITATNGFAELVIPSSVFEGEEGDELNFNLVNGESGQNIISRPITIIDDEMRLILPYIPEQMSSDENVKAEFGGLQVEEEFACSLQYIRSDIDYAFASSTYLVETDSCEFDYELTQYRNNSQALIKLEAGDKVFHKVVTNVSGEAANLFTIAPEIKVDSRDELQMRLHTSPIIDQQGLAVTEGALRFDYNGKVIEAPIMNGLATIEAPASLFDSKDIKEIGRDKYLDLDISAKASVLSISQTNNLEIFLNDNDIADDIDAANLIEGRNIIKSGDLGMFAFETESCNAILTSSLGGSQIAQSHYQDDTCYVQVTTPTGEYAITFEENGYRMAEYVYQSVDTTVPEVEWCFESPCKLVVNGSVNTAIEATLFDGDKEYRFDTGEELSNELFVEQNGLNPLKNYRVEVSFEDSEGHNHVVAGSILGELLIK